LRARHQIPWLSVLLPLVLGVPFLVIGGLELAKVAQWVERSARVTGTVVDNVRVPFGADALAYVPVVEFVTLAEREPVRFTDAIGSDPWQFEVGAQVEVLYDPANPADARVRTWMRLWFMPALLVGAGVLPGAVGFAVTAVMRRRRMGMA
jgi:hypothetical protein